MGTKASERVREGGGGDFNVGVGVRVGVEHFYRITKSDSNGVDNWPQNRLSRVGVGISPGLLFPSLPFLFQSEADVRPISEQVKRRTFTQTCGTWLYSRRASLLKAF